MTIEDRDSWETPKELWNKMNEQYKFTCDCCATWDNRKTKTYCSDFEIVNNFEQDICWMNPPFSKVYAMFEQFFKVVKQGVAIYRCDNIETKVWQEVILQNASWVFFPKGRISYEGQEGKGARFPSALIGFNTEMPNGIVGIGVKIHLITKDVE